MEQIASRWHSITEIHDQSFFSRIGSSSHELVFRRKDVPLGIKSITIMRTNCTYNAFRSCHLWMYFFFFFNSQKLRFLVEVDQCCKYYRKVVTLSIESSSLQLRLLEWPQQQLVVRHPYTSKPPRIKHETSEQMN